MSTSRRRPLIVAGLTAAAVAVIGGLMTKIGPWYEGLTKPDWTPPDWLFAPAWTIIYALAVFAAVRGWTHVQSGRERAWLVSLFFINAVLNVLWSALFFSLQRPDFALAEVVTLWLSVLALVVFLWPRERAAALALLPYLIWVGFASALNLAIVRMNGSFA
ncbi:MAG: TspO/MBR family protein [Parvularcula sp.]|nr:TspO/MBR family protein [Parvularcula sp.]